MSSESQDFNSVKWIEEEYRTLQENYYHEDNYFQKLTGFYATLHVSLLAFIGSEFVADTFVAKCIIPILGILLSINWFIALVRQKEIRDEVLDRLEKIEEYLHTKWQDEEFLPLDSFSFKRWNEKKSDRVLGRFYHLLKEVPVSITTLYSPILFVLTWIGVLIFHVF